MLRRSAAVYRKDGLILSESDLHTIKDPTLRHQVTLVFAQNRSLHNKLNILKQMQANRRCRWRCRSAYADGRGQLILTVIAEIAAIRDFVYVRKLKAKHLEAGKRRRLDDR